MIGAHAVRVTVASKSPVWTARHARPSSCTRRSTRRRSRRRPPAGQAPPRPGSSRPAGRGESGRSTSTLLELWWTAVHHFAAWAVRGEFGVPCYLPQSEVSRAVLLIVRSSLGRGGCSGRRATKETMQPLSNPPASHLFGFDPNSSPGRGGCSGSRGARRSAASRRRT